MPPIDIRDAAPAQVRLSEDGELVAEIFRDDNAFEEHAPFHVVELSEDPGGPRRIYARERPFETARWTVDSHPLR